MSIVGVYDDMTRSRRRRAAPTQVTESQSLRGSNRRQSIVGDATLERVTRKSTASRSSRGAKGSPKTPREAGSTAQNTRDGVCGQQQHANTATSKVAKAAKVDMIATLPQGLRERIFSFIGQDAHKLARYRTVNKMFAELALTATRRLTMTGKVRLVMARRAQVS